MKTFLLALSLCLSASSQDPQSAKRMYLRMQDGSVLSGTFVRLEGDTVTLRANVLDGTMEVRRKLDQFEPASAWRLEMAADPPTDYAEHFAMARKAARRGLLKQAGNEARAALKASEGGPEIESRRAEMRRWAAGALETNIAAAVKEGDLTQARHCLKLLTTRLSDQRTEEQLDAIAKTVEACADKRKQSRSDARKNRLDEKTHKEIEQRLVPIRKNIANGDKSYRQAVRKSRSTTTSSKLCDYAVRSYKKAWDQLTKLLKAHPEDRHLADIAAELGKQIHDQGIRAALHAANVLTVQSDYKGAMDWVTRILVYEPDNAEAKEMRRTIQIAEAEASGEWRWGWRIVNDRPSMRQR